MSVHIDENYKEQMLLVTGYKIVLEISKKKSPTSRGYTRVILFHGMAHEVIHRVL